MALDLPIFKTVAPEFNNIDPSLRDTAASLAELQVIEGKYRLKYPYAVALMTAHILKIAEKNGDPGAVNSETVGSLSKSFSNPQIDDSYDTTTYGQEFKRVRKQIASSPLVV